jgi:hypothetical protein
MQAQLACTERSRSEVAHVLQRVDTSLLKLHPGQLKTLRAIAHCRTAALGGHVDACDACGNISVSYNSCRNRHCPKCQGHKREEWIQKREQDLLPCTYYHVVFTLPHELNPLALRHTKIVYDSLFHAAWQTLQQFGLKEGIQLGAIGVLHTWGQNLSLHPHLHCIVPGGGVDAHGKWRRKVKSNKYLFAVKALSKVFRAKFVALLRKQKILEREISDALFQKDWVVYAKMPFGGPKQVIEYLGRYTHKVAISNHRILSVTDTEVSFKYKDYTKDGLQKSMTLSNDEFVRRFALHILPHRFVRIRHFGILSSAWKRGKLQELQFQTNIILADKPLGTLLRKCPCCKIGNLITIEIFGIRGPPASLLTAKPSVPAIAP